MTTRQLPENVQTHSYKLPHVTACYIIQDYSTGETYVGSTNNMNIRFKTHRKKQTDAIKLLNRATSHLTWYECKDVETARAMERAGYFAYCDLRMTNEYVPSGYLEKPCMTAAEAKEQKKQRTVGWNQLNPERAKKHQADYRARKGL